MIRLLGAAVLIAVLAPSARAQVSGSGLAGGAEYRVRTAAGFQRYSGTLTGLRADLTLGSSLGLEVVARGGTLAADSAVDPSRTMADVAARLTLRAAPWLSLHGTMGLRGFSTVIGTQRWFLARAGADVRLPFATGALTAVARGEFLPVVRTSGVGDPTVAASAAAGLEWNGAHLVAGLRYEIERFRASAGSSDPRREQFTAIVAWVGLRLAGAAPENRPTGR